MPISSRRYSVNITANAGVYGILNTRTLKIYVGSAVSIRARCYQHRAALRKRVHCNSYLQRSWNKYGESTFRFVVLEECSPEECANTENKWIVKLDAANPIKGYNLAKTADRSPMLGRNHSQKSCQQMSTKRKGIVPIEATAAAAMTNRGRKRSEEVRKKISDGHLGRVFSEEHKAKIRANHWSRTGKATDIIARMSASLQGRQLTEEHKANISEGVLRSRLNKS